MRLKTGNSVFCCLLLTLSLSGQQRVRDSLNRQVRTAHDTAKVLSLNRISRLLLSNDPDSGLVVADSALRLANRIGYENGKGISYLNLGSAQNTAGRYDQAIDYLIKSLVVLEKGKNKKALTNAYNTLANTYVGLNNQPMAYTNFLKSHQLAAQAPRDEYLMAVTGIGLGGVLMEQGKYAQSIRYYQEAERQFKSTNNPEYAAMATSMIAEVYEKSGDDFTAEKYFRGALPVFRKVNNSYALASALRHLGNIEMRRRNYNQAVIYLQDALNINLHRHAMDNIQSDALELSQAFERMGRPAQALEHYKLYMQYKDSVVNIARHQAVANAESKYKAEKKEKELQLKNMELLNSRLQVSRRNSLIYVFAAATGVVALLLFFVYRQFSEKRKANHTLLLRNAEVQTQKFIIEEKNKDITDSINYARHIQQAILPSITLFREVFPQSFVIFKPKDIVSGDFYLLHHYPDHVYIGVVDCTGHGVPGAMLSVFAQAALKNTIASGQYHHNPAGLLTELCSQFKNHLQADGSSLAINDGVDMGLCIVHLSRRLLYFAGARNNLLRSRNGELSEFPGNRYGISGSNTGIQTEYTDYMMDMQPGDNYYLFTDGFADQFGGPEGKKFMTKQLKDMLLSLSGLSHDVQKNAIEERFAKWRGNLAQLDDVTLIGFGV